MYTTEFCCCKLKPHSYFLMINLVIMAVLSGMLTTINVDLLYGKRSLVIVVFEAVLLVIGVALLVITAMTFFYYVIRDTIHAPFTRFFARVSFVGTIACLVISAVIMIITMAQSSDKNQLMTFLVLVRWIWVTVFLALLISWTLKLVEIVEKSQQSEQKVEFVDEDIESPCESAGIKQVSQVPGPEIETAQPREFNGNRLHEARQSLKESQKVPLVDDPKSRNQNLLIQSTSPKPLANVAQDNLNVETKETEQ